MSESCPLCGQIVTQAETLEEVFAAFKKHASIYSWAHSDNEGWVKVPNLGMVQIVEISDSVFDDPGYDEHDIYMVFEVANKGFYRIDGTKSSYDGSMWNNYCTKVQKQKKEIWVYE